MAKPKKTKTAADILFQSAPSHVRELHEQSKKLKRNASRSIWWDENKDKFLK